MTAEQNVADVSRYAIFEQQFAYSGDRVYELIYQRNRNRIRTKRSGVAIVNLRRIFEHTFILSRRVGFQEMSLRQLSNESGISIGGIYACIESKQDLALMACDCVTYIGRQFMQSAFVPTKHTTDFNSFVTDSVFMAEVMHDWLNFLYADARGLSDAEERHMNELSEVYSESVRHLRARESNVHQLGDNPVWFDIYGARLACLLLGDWVLQRQEFRDKGITVEHYAEYAVKMLSGNAQVLQPSSLTAGREQASSIIESAIALD